MNKTLCLLALVAAVALPAAAANAQNASPVAVAGKMLYAGGKPVAAVYGVQSDGSAQIMLDDHLVVVPASTLTVDSGKLTTSLTRAQLAR